MGAGGHWTAPSPRKRPLEYAGLRGEGSTPAPLPPPALPNRCNLRAILSAIKPSSSSDSSFKLRTPNRQSLVIILRKARFSPKLWTPQIWYGSRNLNVSKDLCFSTKTASAAPLGQARVSSVQAATRVNAEQASKRTKLSLLEWWRMLVRRIVRDPGDASYALEPGAHHCAGALGTVV
jgi:hypothetical protein